MDLYANEESCFGVWYSEEWLPLTKESNHNYLGLGWCDSKKGLGSKSHFLCGSMRMDNVEDTFEVINTYRLHVS